MQLPPDLRAIRRRRRCEALKLLWVWRWLWRRGSVSSPAARGWGGGHHLRRAPPAASAATSVCCRRFAPAPGSGRGARRTPPISYWRRVLLIGAVAAQVELPRVERRRAGRRARRELLLAPLRAAAPRGRRRLSCCRPTHASAAAGPLRAAAEGVGTGHGAGGRAPRGDRVAGRGDHRRGCGTTYAVSLWPLFGTPALLSVGRKCRCKIGPSRAGRQYSCSAAARQQQASTVVYIKPGPGFGKPNSRG